MILLNVVQKHFKPILEPGPLIDHAHDGYLFARPTSHAARCFGQAGADAVHENRHTIIDFLILAHYRHTKTGDSVFEPPVSV